ncbi:PREDICTED: cytoplasmic dynein 1 intermediate chain-like isoform X1 [Rhagoletis zephyria]|uniref:cytoplasmic dynein 1 intermediate chain-like isoform X1 n=1 Tax=Rhagoletis zephyria TaxID=28612 RepID=UPI00081142D9|nr:PREDICTED: cytoplasmic dynein 1 intermediate chain-like isoform X1 [Rhagoletis zephyria]XP_017481922.1 PREDICTED: cytoplasmic dynein 1 intermediate chain-like isoform X1 [Rhagoletis zephyria]
MDRKAELERKKAKLAALREEKDRRRREKEMKDMEEAAGRIGGGVGIDKDQRKDLDEMLSSLGVAPVSEVLSSLSSVNSLTSDNSNTQTPDASLQANMNGVGGPKKQPLNLSVYNVQATNIPPKETLVYSKQTQTTSSGGHERDVLSCHSSPLSGYMEDWWRPRKAHATDYYDEYNLNPGLEWEDEFTGR